MSGRSLETLMANGFDLYEAFGATNVNKKFGTGASIDESLTGSLLFFISDVVLLRSA